MPHSMNTLLLGATLVSIHDVSSAAHLLHDCPNVEVLHCKGYSVAKFNENRLLIQLGTTETFFEFRANS